MFTCSVLALEDPSILNGWGWMESRLSVLSHKILKRENLLRSLRENTHSPAYFVRYNIMVHTMVSSLTGLEFYPTKNMFFFGHCKTAELETRCTVIFFPKVSVLWSILSHHQPHKWLVNDLRNWISPHCLTFIESLP